MSASSASSVSYAATSSGSARKRITWWTMLGSPGSARAIETTETAVVLGSPSCDGSLRLNAVISPEVLLAARSLRWGVLGCAEIAPTLIAAVRASGCGTVAAVASRELSRARSFAAAHSVPLAFGAYAELLDSGTVDVIYNPLPNTMHAEWTTRALERGLPVLCEKPFTTSYAAACEVAALARRVNLPVAEAFMYRHHPLWDSVQETLAGGAIGELVSIFSRFTFLLEDRTLLPANAALGGGALMDVGCYCIDLARQVAKCEPVLSFAIARSRDPGRGVDDTMSGVSRMESGVLAAFECSIESFETHSAELTGTKGAISIPSPWHPGLERGRFLLTTEHAPGRRETREVITPGGDAYVLEVQDFARAVLTHSDPRWPVEDAVANAAALERLREVCQIRPGSSQTSST